MGSLLDYVVNVILVLLVVRFFLEDYTFYGFGPLLHTVFQITDFFCKPLQSALASESRTIQRATPWIAIGLILVIRGLWWWWIFPDGSRDQSVLPPPIQCLFNSFLQFVNLVYILVIALLLVSVLLAKEGVAFYSSAGYKVFQEKTFRVLQITQSYLRTHNLWRLFAGSVVWLTACHFVIASLLSWGVFRGYGYLFGREVLFQLEAAAAILQVYYFILLVAIVTSWVNPDPRHPVVAVVRALAEPYLHIFRRLCPWARVGMIDFSPILAFFALFFARQVLTELARSIARAMVTGSI